MRGTIALIGFGEAGSTFARAAAWGSQAAAFDKAAARRAVIDELGVTSCDGAAQALSGAALVLSLVPADQALNVARECAGLIAPEALFCDMNSVAPGTKREAASAFAEAGKRYVDVAVMAPVNPAHMAVPLNISGPDAAEAESLVREAGFTRTAVVGDAIGRASAIKLVRSVMVKGVEALTAEMMLAAHAEGVADAVLASLDASEKTNSWPERADYNLDRMLIHGRRRAAEMAEAAQMLRDLGIDPLMTNNTVARQQALGDLAIEPLPQGFTAKLAAITAISKGES
ncbi:NAD-binding 6-phosphogluconate dehydrogenase [Sphingomonas sp. LH128]|uniref:6-phosphogluconate dehydrogenase n=1 Tax=Novosphingobium resinovorum TaxID=158500 RepID=A0A1D8AFD9_9SPHN|nr:MULTISPECIES: NAD(P)-dependent oxidoreductase [Sphingomonadaceae]AOR80836.1 6-phosphogluconate dehydrogenase [Novosphingobium resinovorum]EJU08920.1 NAD-binding 6-phosphogluconate dehydrogenase [Sphingomonas sp. LH128]